MYHGEYIQDKKNGFGVYVWVDGRAYLGNWTAGKQDNERVYILPNGQVRKGLYDGNTRKEWLNLTEAEQTSYKQKLEEALHAASKVKEQVEKAQQEFAQIKRVEKINQEKHQKEEILIEEAPHEVAVEAQHVNDRAGSPVVHERSRYSEVDQSHHQVEHSPAPAVGNTSQ